MRKDKIAIIGKECEKFNKILRRIHIIRNPIVRRFIHGFFK